MFILSYGVPLNAYRYVTCICVFFCCCGHQQSIYIPMFFCNLQKKYILLYYRYYII
jgi:hypothetical protein